MRRGFSILEVMVVLVVLAIVSAIALPSISGMAKRRQEIEVSGETHSVLHRARDTAYKELQCVRVTDDPARGIVAEKIGCQANPDAGTLLVATVPIDPAVVTDVEFSGTADLTFQPSGGLLTGSPARVVRLRMASGRQAVFEVQPSIGSIQECRGGYDPGKVPACLQ